MSPTMQVLDVGCGDGFYTRLIAERLISPGSVTGLDINPTYIELARRTVTASQVDVQFIQGNLADLRDENARWDLVWCAQSLYSLPEPVEALSQMANALRPGGMVVVLENDTMHQLLLPWPTELEIVLRAAELASFAEESHQPAKFYVGRRLPEVFAEAGLETLSFRTQCIDRQTPLDKDVRTFVELYLLDLMERSKDRLDRDVNQELMTLIDTSSDRCLVRQPHFTMSWLNVLVCGRKK